MGVNPTWGIVKCLLGQLTEQMSGVPGDPRAGGSSLRKSEWGSRKTTASHLCFSEHLKLLSFLLADFPCLLRQNIALPSLRKLDVHTLVLQPVSMSPYTAKGM